MLRQWRRRPSPPPAKSSRCRAIRLAEPFEQLRDASDRMLARTGARPKIFLANLGKPSDFTARATFAKNFFEAGGIEAVSNDGFAGRDEMIAALKASGARTGLSMLVGRGVCAARRRPPRRRCAARVPRFGSPAGPARSRQRLRRPACPASFSPVVTPSPRCGQPTVSLPADVKAIRLAPTRVRFVAAGNRNQRMSNPERPFGWRKRIGLLSPTVIETAAYDFYRLAPDGVSMCATTSNIEHWSRENFQQHVLEPIVTAVKYLASRNVDYIIHTGMPVVTTRGKGFEDELVNQIEEVTGLPATTSIRSAIRALAHLGVRNVAVVTPYPRELHESALSFPRRERFPRGRRSHDGRGLQAATGRHPAQIAATTRHVLASAPSADGVYIPCNQWSAADAAPLIEDALGIPVVTGAHADYWEAFRSVGIRDRIEGHGRLMLS